MSETFAKINYVVLSKSVSNVEKNLGGLTQPGFCEDFSQPGFRYDELKELYYLIHTDYKNPLLPV